MPQLVSPDVRFHASFLGSHREWAGSNQDGAGILGGEDFESVTGFTAYVRALREQETVPFRSVKGPSPAPTVGSSKAMNISDQFPSAMT